MSIVPSLLQAIVHVDGEALVMHAGDKPYVVAPTGQMDLASRGLTLEAVNGILNQLLPSEFQQALDEFGAVQYELHRSAEFPREHFTVVAARGGDDVWVEVRRRRAVDDQVPEEMFAQAAAAAAAPSVAASSPQPTVTVVDDEVPIELLGGESPRGAGRRGVRLQDDLVLPDASQLFPARAGRADETRVDESRLAQNTATASTHEADAASEASRLAAALIPPPKRIDPLPPRPTAFAPATPGVEAPGPRIVQSPPPMATPSPSFAAITPPPPVAPPPVVEPAMPQPAAIVTAEPVSASAPEPIEIVAAEPVATMSPEPIEVAVPEPIEPVALETPAFEAAAFEPVAMEQPEPVAAEEAPAPIAAVTPEPIVPPVVEPELEIEMPAPAWSREVREIEEAPVVHAAAEAEPVVMSAFEAATYEMEPIAESRERPHIETAQLPMVPPPQIAEPEPTVPAGQRMDSSSHERVAPPQPAVVLSMARSPIRSDTAPLPIAEPTMSGLDRLLRMAAARGASTLYLSSETRPSVRVDGELQVLDGESELTARDVESLLLTLMPERSHEALRTGTTSEWIVDIDGIGRVRCMSFRDHLGPGGVFRLMPTRSISVEQLTLPPQIQALAIEPEGLVLVAGPRSSGKRTLMAAYVDLINRTRRDHVITIEREINIVHERGSSFISQREVRGSDDDLQAAARAALREDPDVLVIEDLRTGGLMNVALEAAASGHLVIGGFSAHTATGAIDRIIDMYTPENRRHVQLALSDTLRGVIVQLLLRRVAGGRVAAREVLLNTPAVASVLAEGKTSQLPMALEGGRRYGMVPMNDSLVGLVQNGTVDSREAYRHSTDRQGFLALLKRQGLDTSFAERLA